MTHRLTLICHGATAATRDARFPSDEPIEPASARLAASLGGDLRHADRVRAAPARRAIETARALALAAPLAIDEALRDLDHGDWAGRTLADVAGSDPEGLAAWMADPGCRPHGGETITDLILRVSSWLDERLAERGHSIAVTHVPVVRAAILVLLDAPPQSFWRIDVVPLATVELSGDGRRWALRAGIPPRMISP